MDISGHLGGSFLANTDLPNPYQVWTISKVEEEWFGQAKVQSERSVLLLPNIRSLWRLTRRT